MPQETPDIKTGKLPEAGEKFLPICTDPTSVKYIRVNVHYILRSDFSGNFRPNDDGMGNTNYNGYQHAEDVINQCNLYWANNPQHWLPSPNNTPALPQRVQLVLTGVYFRNSDLYYADDADPDMTNFAVDGAYAVNPQNTINIYFYGYYWGSDGIAFFGRSTKIYNAWAFYHGQQGPALSKRLVARTVNHELGHLFNLHHTFPSLPFTDYCNDTPPNNRCWAFDPTDANCDEWSEISNNLMDYNTYDPATTPCQITRIHNRLNTTSNIYIHSCAGCMPANAFFSLPTVVCTLQDGPNVMLDGRGSWAETLHSLEICEVAATGSNTCIGGYYAGTFTGTVGNINLKAYCNNYNFQIGKTYRVRLAVSNTTCVGSSEQIGWFSVQHISSPSCTQQGNGPKNWIISESQERTAPEIRIFPNPGDHFALLEATAAPTAQLTAYLTTLTGEILHTFSQPHVQGGIWQYNVPLADIPAGIYFVTLQTAEGARATTKIFVIH